MYSDDMEIYLEGSWICIRKIHENSIRMLGNVFQRTSRLYLNDHRSYFVDNDRESDNDYDHDDYGHDDYDDYDVNHYDDYDDYDDCDDHDDYDDYVEDDVVDDDDPDLDSWLQWWKVIARWSRYQTRNLITFFVLRGAAQNEQPFVSQAKAIFLYPFFLAGLLYRLQIHDDFFSLQI